MISVSFLWKAASSKLSDVQVENDSTKTRSEFRSLGA